MYNKKVLTGIYQRVVGAMSGLSDINVEIHEQVVPHWEPESKTIRMPLKISYAETEQESFELGRGTLVHEASHVLFCPDDEYQKLTKGVKDKDLHEWLNVFADVNNEWKVICLWKHLQEPLAKKTMVVLNKHPDMLETDNPFMQILLRCNKTVDVLDRVKYPVGYNKEIITFIEEVVKDFNDNNIKECKGIDLVKFTIEVNEKWKKLKKKCKMPNSSKMKKLMQQLGGLIKRGASGTQISKKEAEIKEAGKVNWFKQEVDKKLINTLALSHSSHSSLTNYNGLSIAELKKRLEQAKKEKGGKLGGGGWGCAKIPEKNKVEVIIPDRTKDYYEFDLKSAYEQGKKINRALRRKITLQEDYEKRHRSGIIDFEEVRRQVGQMGRITKENIFERDNIFSRGGMWAIEILIDCSTSMSNRKMCEAKQALGTLAYALDGLPNVKYALTGFSYCDDVNEYPIKKFGDRRFNINLLKGLTTDGGNADGINIRRAGNRLLKFRNAKKVLVVISDGQPAYQDGIADTHKAVKECEDKRISVLGIGIEGCTQKSLEEIYPKPYYFENTADLHKELTALILKCLGNRDVVKLVKRVWER